MNSSKRDLDNNNYFAIFIKCLPTSAYSLNRRSLQETFDVTN